MRKEIILPRNKTVRLQIPCFYCKELFWTTETYIAKGRKYCSMKCVAIDKKFGLNKTKWKKN